MNSSDTAWFGEIAKDWKLSKISSIYELRTTKVSDKDYPPLSVTMQGIVPQLDSVAKTNAHDDRKLVKKGDFAINSRSDRRGSCGVSDYDGSVSLINIVMKPRDEMNPDYYNWLFHTTQFADEFFKWGHGIVADLWTTNWQDMKNIDIPVPSLKEQKKIADYLDGLVPEIDTLHSDIEKQIEILEEYKKSVITEAVTKGLNPDVEMKDSGIEWIGYIPRHWEKQRLINLSDNEKYSIVDGPFGSDMKNEEYTDEGVPIVQLTNIKPFSHYINEVKYITEEKSQQLKRHSAYPGDIVIAKMMPAGRACILNDEYDRYIVAADAIRCKCSEVVNKYFVLYCLNTYCMTECELVSKGTTRVRISLEIARRLTLFLPPRVEQDIIVDSLNDKCIQIDGAIEEKKRQLEILEEYKKSIIYEYVTGKREVPNNE